MRWLSAVVTISAAAVLSCAQEEAKDPYAALCARATGHYLGLPDPVAVRTETDSGPGIRTIEYQSFNAENIPVEGSATCVFEGSPAKLVRAVLNGKALGPEDIASLNRSLAAAEQ